MRFRTSPLSVFMIWVVTVYSPHILVWFALMGICGVTMDTSLMASSVNISSHISRSSYNAEVNGGRMNMVMFLEKAMHQFEMLTWMVWGRRSCEFLLKCSDGIHTSIHLYMKYRSLGFFFIYWFGGMYGRYMHVVVTLNRSMFCEFWHWSIKCIIPFFLLYVFHSALCI